MTLCIWKCPERCLIYVCIRCKFYYGTQGGLWDFPLNTWLPWSNPISLIQTRGRKIEGVKEEELEEIYNPDIDFSKKRKRGGCWWRGQITFFPLRLKPTLVEENFLTNSLSSWQQKHWDGMEDRQHKTSIIAFVKHFEKIWSGIWKIVQHCGKYTYLCWMSRSIPIMSVHSRKTHSLGLFHQCPQKQPMRLGKVATLLKISLKGQETQAVRLSDRFNQSINQTFICIAAFQSKCLQMTSW